MARKLHYEKYSKYDMANTGPLSPAVFEFLQSPVNLHCHEQHCISKFQANYHWIMSSVLNSIFEEVAHILVIDILFYLFSTESEWLI